jgi:hypothetical protein
VNEEDIVYRLQKRAEIRRQIPGRKSVEEGKPDRIADLLEEAAEYIEDLRIELKQLEDYCYDQENT